MIAFGGHDESQEAVLTGHQVFVAFGVRGEDDVLAIELPLTPEELQRVELRQRLRQGTIRVVVVVQDVGSVIDCENALTGC